MAGEVGAGYPQSPGVVVQPERQWLSAEDQRVVARGSCAHASREETKLLRDLHSVIHLLGSANEHCKVVTENDPNWFTLDIQDCNTRRMAILRDALAALESDPLPLPSDAEWSDGVKGRVFGTYAQTAHVMSRVPQTIQDLDKDRAKDDVIAAALKVGPAASRLAETSKTAVSSMGAAAGPAASRFAETSKTAVSSVGAAAGPAASRLGAAAGPAASRLAETSKTAVSTVGAAAGPAASRLAEQSKVAADSAGTAIKRMLSSSDADRTPLDGGSSLAQLATPLTGQEQYE